MATGTRQLLVERLTGEASMDLERNSVVTFLAGNVQMLGPVVGLLGLLGLLRPPSHLFHHLVIIDQHHGSNLIKLLWKQSWEHTRQGRIERGDAARKTELVDEEAPDNLSGLSFVDFHGAWSIRPKAAGAT